MTAALVHGLLLALALVAGIATGAIFAASLDGETGFTALREMIRDILGRG